MIKFKNLLFSLTIFFIFSLSNANAGYGNGELQFSYRMIGFFHEYLSNNKGKPLRFAVSQDGETAHWFYCAHAQCTSDGDTELIKLCERRSKSPCATFAVGRSVKWKNGINPGGKDASFKKSMTFDEVKDKLVALGFYGNTQNSNNVSRAGKRALAMNWTGYKNLIVGEIEFKEKNNVGSLKLQLPNNDGKCEGTYALSTTQGTWSLLCSNKMSASGNLVLNSTDGSVTGEGKDTKGNKVEFTVQAE